MAIYQIWRLRLGRSSFLWSYHQQVREQFRKESLPVPPQRWVAGKELPLQGWSSNGPHKPWTPVNWKVVAMGMLKTSWRGCSFVFEWVQNILLPCSLCPLTSTSWANSQLLLSQWRWHHNLEVRFSLQNHFVWLLHRWCRWLHNRIHWSFCSWLG